MALSKSRSASKPPAPAAPTARAQVTKTSLMVELPLALAGYLGLTEAAIKGGTPIYCVPLNGVVQLSTRELAVSIPSIPLEADEFLGQERVGAKARVAEAPAAQGQLGAGEMQRLVNLFGDPEHAPMQLARAPVVGNGEVQDEMRGPLAPAIREILRRGEIAEQQRNAQAEAVAALAPQRPIRRARR